MYRDLVAHGCSFHRGGQRSGWGQDAKPFVPLQNGALSVLSRLGALVISPMTTVPLQITNQDNQECWVLKQGETENFTQMCGNVPVGGVPCVSIFSQYKGGCISHPTSCCVRWAGCMEPPFRRFLLDYFSGILASNLCRGTSKRCFSMQTPKSLELRKPLLSSPVRCGHRMSMGETT